jgi:hypothetical protein
MTSLIQSKARLIEAGHRLSENWRSAREVWNDAPRHDFEKQYWIEFEATTAQTVEKLQDLIDAVAQAERKMP